MTPKLTRRLKQRRRLRNISTNNKHSKSNKSNKSNKSSKKYKKTSTIKYIKKIRSITRKRLSNGGTNRKRIRALDIDVEDIDLSDNNREHRFRDLVNALEKNPEIMNDAILQYKYKNMIELSDGYIGLTGLKFINYLSDRVNELDPEDEEYENLQRAISLMDQTALALGITCEQLGTIKSKTNEKYFCCYLKLFKDLKRKLRIESRGIPLSTSACYTASCDESSDEACEL